MSINDLMSYNNRTTCSKTNQAGTSGTCKNSIVVISLTRRAKTNHVPSEMSSSASHRMDEIRIIWMTTPSNQLSKQSIE